MNGNLTTIVAAVSVGEWVAILGAAFTALGALTGGVWWMASLYSKVTSIASSSQESREAIREVHELIDELRDERDTANEKIWTALHSHEHRIGILEVNPAKWCPLNERRERRKGEQK